MSADYCEACGTRYEGDRCYNCYASADAVGELEERIAGLLGKLIDEVKGLRQDLAGRTPAPTFEEPSDRPDVDAP